MNPGVPTPSPRGAAASPGFTLIELLVVITIIAILVALVFPALSAVQRKGYQTTSVSNLHQWYAGFATSVGDNDGEMPTPGAPTADPGEAEAWYNRIPIALRQTPF